MGLPILEGGEKQMPGTAMPHEQEKAQIKNNLLKVKRKIGIHSGKGGVGKTFLSVNIAKALVSTGKKTGLLDCDVDCPNVAKFMNLRALQLQGTAEGRIFPLEYKGMKIISTHFLTDNPTLPMIVRGPIKHKVVAELLEKVEWEELDALIYDLPPGTADIPMSSMLVGDLDGIIVVTTPQKEAVMDARKSALMSRDLDVPVLGIVENMSGDIFGEGTGKELATELGVPFLGTIPLSKSIRMMNEKGNAALVSQPELKTVTDNLMKAVMGEEITMKKKFWNTIFG